MAVTARRALSLRTWETRGIWGICQRTSTVRRNNRTESPSSRLVFSHNSGQDVPWAETGGNPHQLGF